MSHESMESAYANTHVHPVGLSTKMGVRVRPDIHARFQDVLARALGQPAGEAPLGQDLEAIEDVADLPEED